MRERSKAVKRHFREGLYRDALIAVQHALELAAKALLCGCCVATREELREELVHRMMDAVRLAWKRIPQLMAEIGGGSEREELEQHYAELRGLDELNKKVAKMAAIPLADVNALLSFYQFVEYAGGFERGFSEQLSGLATPIMRRALRVLELGLFTYLLSLLTLYHLPFERTYSALNELKRVESSTFLTQWGLHVAGTLDQLLESVEKFIEEVCPDLCEFFRAAQTA
jgi:HEPN domain-containing protein